MNLNPIAFEPPMTFHIRSQHIANINSEYDRHHFIINESVKLHFIIIKQLTEVQCTQYNLFTFVGSILKT